MNNLRVTLKQILANPPLSKFCRWQLIALILLSRSGRDQHSEEVLISVKFLLLVKLLVFQTYGLSRNVSLNFVNQEDIFSDNDRFVAIEIRVLVQETL